MNSQRPFRLLSLSGGFWVAVVLGMMGSLCIVLISTSVGGAQGWVNIAVGGAWGAIGAVAIFLGWNVVGPVLVGAADPAARAALFVDSFLARLLAFVVVSPLVILLIRLFTHSSEAFQLQAPAALTAMAMGLGASWFFIGAAQPSHLLLADAVPRLMVVACGSVAAMSLSDLAILPWSLFAGEVSIAVLSLALIVGPKKERILIRGVASRIRLAMSGNSYGFATAVSATAYVQLPIVVGSFLAVGLLPQIALGDRLKAMALRALMPPVHVAQAYVPQAQAHRELVLRTQRTVRLSIALGILAALVFTGFAPFVAGFISVGEIRLSFAVSGLFGVVVGAVVVTGVLGTACLVAWGKQKALFISTFVGAIVGLVLMAAFGRLYDGLGIVISVAVAEMLVLSMQLVFLKRAIDEAAPTGKVD